MTTFPVQGKPWMVVDVHGDGTATVRGKCVLSGRGYLVFNVECRGFQSWLNGATIQSALPDLDAEQREFLISGISPIAFDEVFPETEDEDD